MQKIDKVVGVCPPAKFERGGGMPRLTWKGSLEVCKQHWSEPVIYVDGICIDAELDEALRSAPHLMEAGQPLRAEVLIKWKWPARAKDTGDAE